MGAVQSQRIDAKLQENADLSLKHINWKHMRVDVKYASYPNEKRYRIHPHIKSHNINLNKLINKRTIIPGNQFNLQPRNHKLRS